jgi:hypothetical protein
MPDEKVSHLETVGTEDFNTKQKFKPGAVEMEKPAVFESQAEQKETKSESEALYQKILSTAQQSQAVTDDRGVTSDAQAVSQKTDADSQVQQLVDLALTKGVVHAVKVAKKLGDFYVLDKVHDELTSRFYEALVEKGLVTKE